MNIVNVQIDIDTPTGRKLLREVQKHPKVAKIEQELPEELAEQKLYTLDESFERCFDILSDHYGTDVRKVAMELPEELAEQKLFTLDEVFGSVEDKLNNYYGTNFKLKC